MQAFAIALEHAADVMERDLLRHAGKRLRRGVPLEEAGLQEIATLHATLQEQLRLAIAVFMLEDAEAARHWSAARKGCGSRNARRRGGWRPARAAPPGCCWMRCATCAGSAGISPWWRIRCWSGAASCCRAGWQRKRHSRMAIPPPSE